MRTVLITGADGFAGSVLLEHLRQQGYKAVAGVRNRARKLALEQRYIRSLVCEVADAINVARVVAAVKPDSIVHLAGMTRAYEAEVDPLAGYQSIVTGWANVLDAARRVVPRARILLISACDVYGTSATADRPLSESDGICPATTFGSLKATAESIAHTFHKNHHLDITIARPFHHTGPCQSEHFFFGAVAKRLAAWDPSVDGDQLELPDLDCRRDVLHVKDVAEAYEALLTNGRPNEVYNVCANATHTCRELVQTMIDASGVQVTLRDQPPSDDESCVPPVLWGDNRKICEETGWQPASNANTAVTELMRHCQSQVAART